MSIKRIKERIAELLSEVEGIGQVKKNSPYAKTEEEFIEKFTKDDKVNVWLVDSGPIDEVPYDMKDLNRSTMTIRIRGILSYSEEQNSQDEFDDQIDAIRQFFRGRWNLINLKDEMDKWYVENSDPPSIGTPVITPFGGYACHFVEITLRLFVRYEYQEGN